LILIFQNEAINGMLAKYCDFTEELALARITKSEFNSKVVDWQRMIKSKMPKFYRMEAHLIFFNFYETEIIRRSIKEDMEAFYCSKIKNIMFATSAKVYPYQNQVVSVRIVLAKFSKILEEDIQEKDEIIAYKEELLKDPDAPVEEEKDSDEEEVKEGEDNGESENNQGDKKDGDTKDGDKKEPTKQLSNITVENK